MKTLRIVSVLAFAALAGTTACDNSKLTDLNVNPNGPVDAPAPFILPAVINVAVTTDLWTVWTNFKLGGVTVQQLSEVQYRDEEKYIYRSDAASQVWNMYTGPIEDAQVMINKGIASKTPNWEATGRILKAWMFGIMTDYFGNIPYSEALTPTNLTPKYDTQQSIYAANFAELAKAGALIDPSGISFSSGDLIYGGDMTKWKKLAYSLMLRDAIHLSNADPTTGAAMAQKAIAGGVFQSNDDNAQLVYLSGAPNQNPVYSDRYVSNRDDFGMGKAFVDSLTTLGDPRLPIYAQPNADGNYQGLAPGLNDGEGVAIKYISRAGAMWREDPTGPMPIMTYAEVLLLEAEAAQRGWISGSPAALYTAAITASMQQYGIPQAEIDTYLAQPRVQFSSATAYQQIGLQKWFALFMNGIEAYTEVRRTDIPHIVPGLHATLPKIPTRVAYISTEGVLNKAMLDAAVAAQHFSDAADIQTPLWFAKK